jgi:hypothetical protein
LLQIAERRLDQLVHSIVSAETLPTAPLWHSTTVRICALKPAASSYGKLTGQSRTIWVITESADNLSWCFLQLQDILTPVFNYIDHSDVFGHLADIAIEFLGRNCCGEQKFEADLRARVLLLLITQSARRLLSNTCSPTAD